MNFYNQLSKYYDIIFLKDEDTVNFLCSGMEKNSKVLDLACGSGTYAIALAEKGFNVTGVDLDLEMINLASKKQNNAKIRFLVEDMRKVGKVFENKSFHRVFCIGNSLVHINDKEEIKNVIKDIFELLDYEGTMILQIINYDRILKYDIKSLPTIKRAKQGLEFVRNYRYKPNENLIYFETAILINNDKEQSRYENSVPLFPIQSEELVKIIKGVGFTKVDLYGDFNEEEFTDKSYALVIKASK